GDSRHDRRVEEEVVLLAVQREEESDVPASSEPLEERHDVLRAEPLAHGDLHADASRGFSARTTNCPHRLRPRGTKSSSPLTASSPPMQRAASKAPSRNAVRVPSMSARWT